VWGLRVGFVTFGVRDGSAALYGALERKLAGAIRGSISNVSNIGQALLATAYRDPGYDGQRREKYEVLKNRYQEVRKQIAAHAEYGQVFQPVPYNSGYFMCVKVRDGIDAEAVRQRLIKHHGIGVVALGQLLRLAFSSTPLSLVPDLLQGIYRACCEVRDGAA
jgi:aspartate/methionine/tyrosine aminotransferase